MSARSASPDWPEQRSAKKGWSAETGPGLNRAVLEDHLGSAGCGLSLLHGRACDSEVAVDNAAFRRGWAGVGQSRSEVLNKLARNFDNFCLRDDWLVATVGILDRMQAASASRPMRPDAALVDPLVAALMALKMSEAEAQLDRDVKDIVLRLAPPEQQERKASEKLWQCVIEREFRAVLALGHRVAVPTPLELARWLALDMAGKAAVLGSWSVTTESGGRVELEIRADGSAEAVWKDGSARVEPCELANLPASLNQEQGFVCKLTFASGEPSLLRVCGGALAIRGGILAGEGKRSGGEAKETLAELWPGLLEGHVPTEVPAGVEALPPPAEEPRFALLAYYLVEMALVHCPPQQLYRSHKAPTALAIAALRLALGAFGEPAPRACVACLDEWTSELLGDAAPEQLLQQEERSLTALWARPPLGSAVQRKWRRRQEDLSGALPYAPQNSAPLTPGSPAALGSPIASPRGVGAATPVASPVKASPPPPRAAAAGAFTPPPVRVPAVAEAQKADVAAPAHASAQGSAPQKRPRSETGEEEGAAQGSSAQKRPCKENEEEEKASEPQAKAIKALTISCSTDSLVEPAPEPAPEPSPTAVQHSSMLKPRAARLGPQNRLGQPNAKKMSDAMLRAGKGLTSTAATGSSTHAPKPNARDTKEFCAETTNFLGSVFSPTPQGLQADMLQAAWWEGRWQVEYQSSNMTRRSFIEVKGGSFMWRTSPMSLKLSSQAIQVVYPSTGGVQNCLSERCQQDKVFWMSPQNGEVVWTRDLRDSAEAPAAAAGPQPTHVEAEGQEVQQTAMRAFPRRRQSQKSGSSTKPPAPAAASESPPIDLPGAAGQAFYTYETRSRKRPQPTSGPAGGNSAAAAGQAAPGDAPKTKRTRITGQLTSGSTGLSTHATCRGREASLTTPNMQARQPAVC